MTTYALLTHPDADSVVAIRLGQSISVEQFLADVRQLAAALPAGTHVLNACSDRYRFSVGLAAALVARKISLLPPTLTTEMVRQVKQFAPDAFCLVDQTQAIDLPQIDWNSAMAIAPPTSIEAGACDIPHIPASQIAAIAFTSGSTGAPVAHQKSWGGLVQSVRLEAERLGLLDGRHHSVVATVPPQHMYGFESTVLMALQSGATMSATHPFYPADICAALAAAARPRLLVTTPVHLKVLLNSGLDVPTPDLVLSATAPLSPQLAQQAEDALHVPLLEIYGSTETGQIASRRTTENAEWTLFPNIELGFKDTRTWASGGHLDQAVPLADELEILDNGRFLLHGRTADLVNIAGKRSSLGYLNHQLNAIAGVNDGAFYMPDDASGDEANVVRLMAFAVAPGMTAATLMAALRDRVDPIFMPRPLVLLETLPRNATGKIPREALQALARDHHIRNSFRAQ